MPIYIGHPPSGKDKEFTREELAYIASVLMRVAYVVRETPECMSDCDKLKKFVKSNLFPEKIDKFLAFHCKRCRKECVKILVLKTALKIYKKLKCMGIIEELKPQRQK